MPKKTYALEKEGPENLELSWKGIWKKFEIKVDDQFVGGFENQAALKEGQVFTLPDGSTLDVKLDQSMIAAQLNVLYNGKHVQGTAGDPITKLKATYGIIYLVGGLNVVPGLLAYIFQYQPLLRIGVGLPAAIEGAIYLVFAFFVQKRSRIALGLAMALYAADTIFMFVNTDGSFSSGIFIRLFFFYYMWQGFGAIKKLKESEESF